MFHKGNDVVAGDESPLWMSAVKCVLLILLTVTIFLLAEQMVKPRFFRGGWVNQHDNLRP